MDYGASLERGKVTSVTDDGAIIESFDRPGITTPPLKRNDGSIPSVGSTVWYWMTDDGDGTIIGSDHVVNVSYDTNGDIDIEVV